MEPSAATTNSATVERVKRDEWTDLSLAFLDHSYRQSWAFARASARRLGATSEHCALRRGSELIGLADVRVKQLRGLPIGIAYVNGGPLARIGKESDLEHLRSSLLALRREYAVRRGLVLRILPPIGDADWNSAVAQHAMGAGFVPIDQRYRTLLLDISAPLEEIRKALAQKWRNGLNRAERNSLEVESGDDPEQLERFCRLFREFVDRKGFGVDLDARFYADVQPEHLVSERFYTSLVHHEGRVVAGHVSSMLGDTCVYLLGATDPLGLQQKAAYLLQWNAIRVAKSRGLTRYDLGGIDPEGNPGVFHFKKGLSGEDVASQAFECSPGGLQGLAVRSAETLYGRARELRRRFRRPS